MEGRGLTNLLLAVIAGVLLFGRDAMVGGVQGAVIAGAAIAVIFGILMFAAYLLGEIAKAYRESKDWKEAALVTFGLCAGAVLITLACYVGYLWLSGVERPMDVAIDSWFGTAWMAVLIVGIAGAVCVGVVNAVRWLAQNRADVPAYLMGGLTSFRSFLVSPVLFPVREWRTRRDAGTGIAVTVLSSAWVAFVSLIIWLAALMLSFGGVMALLYETGIID